MMCHVSDDYKKQLADKTLLITRQYLQILLTNDAPPCVLYFTAACVKIFQLLLGEVNDCTNWRVSKSLINILAKIPFNFFSMFSYLGLPFSLVIYTPLCVHLCSC